MYPFCFLCVYQVNNSIHVNNVDVPDSDLMATNGVIHVVKNVLYPAGEIRGVFFFFHFYHKVVKKICVLKAT